jgi:phosphoribosylformylglycinamidine synthase
VPQVTPDDFLPVYRALSDAIQKGLTASVHGIYRGGLGVHLAMKAMAGGLGLDVDLSAVPMPEALRDDQILYSESAGRFIVTLDPKKPERLRKSVRGHAGFTGRPGDRRTPVGRPRPGR